MVVASPKKRRPAAVCPPAPFHIRRCHSLAVFNRRKYDRGEREREEMAKEKERGSWTRPGEEGGGERKDGREGGREGGRRVQYRDEAGERMWSPDA